MSSGAHLSKDLYDLIKAIGETRSKQEEDKIISNETKLLKERINDKKNNIKKQKENIIRSIYIEMLGHDASFSYIYAVNLTQNKVLNLKRMGYLSCSLFFHENSELLIMLVATIQRDLQSQNINEVTVALNCLGKLLYKNIVHALVDPVMSLLDHKAEAVRKKAVMIMQRIYNIQPNLIVDYHDRMKRGLCDQDPSVMGAALNLYSDEIKNDCQKFKDLTGSFVVILKQIVEHKLSRDYDYHRMPAPWIQIRILQILAMLAANDLKISEQVYEVLGQTLRRADDTGLNIGYAVTYQCIRTIASIYPNQNLLEQAAFSITRFLTSDNNNLKFMGINALVLIVQISPKYAAEHQMIVVDCLESTDETLKRETLDLLVKMTNGSNITVIVQKLLQYLKIATDSIYRKELVNKIMQLCERFSPDQQWFLVTMNQLFEFGSEHISEEILTNVLSLLQETYTMNKTDYGEFIFNLFYQTLEKDVLPDVIVKMIAWIFGEIGCDFYSGNAEKLEFLAQKLIEQINNVFEDELTKGYILNALSKLSSVPIFPNQSLVQDILDKFSTSKYIELSQRSQDYKVLKKFRACLRQSTVIDVDGSLSFLDQFVQKALSLGAKPYQKSSLKSMLEKMNDQQDSELKYKKYQTDTSHKSNTEKNSQNQGIGGVNASDTGIKGVENQNWSLSGYKQNEEKEKEKDKEKEQQQKQQGFSSANAISSKDVKPSMQGIQSISSSDVNSKEGPWSSMGGVGKGSAQLQHQQVPQKPAYVDPKQKKKEEMANLLFGGIGGGDGQATGGIFGGGAQQKPKQTTTTTPAQKPQTQQQQQQPAQKQQQQQPQNQVQQKPTAQQQNKMQDINLLDIDFNSSTDTNQNKNMNLIQNMSSSFNQQQQQQQGPNYKPYQIPIENFEQLWEQFPDEDIQTWQTQIRTENDFKNLMAKIHFSIIEVIGNEVICAGQQAMSNQVLLLFGGFNSNGSLEIRVKAKNQQDKNDLLNKIKNSLY